MKPASRRRWWRWVAVCAIAAPLLGYAVLTWLLDPQRLGAALLRRAERASGLTLATATPATLGIWPRLHLELDGLTARSGDLPLLSAARIEVALPLSVLWAERPPVGAVTVQAPRVDVAAVQAWLRTRADAATTAPPSLPTTLTVTVHDAHIDGGAWRLERTAIELEPLGDGVVRLVVSARLQAGDLDAPVAAQVLGTPRETAIDAVEIQLYPQTEPAWLLLRGDVEYTRDALAIELAGQLNEWPAQWPQPPATLQPLQTARSLELAYRGGVELQAPLQLQSTAGGDAWRIAAAPAELIAWWRSEPRPPLPPGTVHATQKTLRIGGLQIDGLQIDLDREPMQ